MSGTKMTLRRYGDPSAPYRYHEVVVDAQYLATHLDTVIEIPFPYLMNMHMLDVWYNGKYLLAGRGYTEIDAYHIQLNVRDSQGNPLTQFQIDDEIALRIWSYPPVYNDTEEGNRQLGYVLGEGNFDVMYDYQGDDLPTKETVVGDYSSTTELTFTSFGKKATEKIKYGNKEITRTYVYDPVTYNLVRVEIRTTIIP